MLRVLLHWGGISGLVSRDDGFPSAFVLMVLGADPFSMEWDDQAREEPPLLAASLSPFLFNSTSCCSKIKKKSSLMEERRKKK